MTITHTKPVLTEPASSWLLHAAPDPARAQRHWASTGITELACGTGVFDAVFTTASIGEDAVDLLGNAAGPALRYDCGQLTLLVRPGTLRAWNRHHSARPDRVLSFTARGAEPGERIVVPAPNTRSTGMYWYRSPTLPFPDPDQLAAALAIAANTAVGSLTPAEADNCALPRRRASALRAVVYAAGADPGELPALVEEARRLAMLRGWQVADVATECCDPAVPLMSRAGWGRAFAAALGRGASGVVVASGGCPAYTHAGYSEAVDQLAGCGLFVARSGGVL